MSDLSSSLVYFLCALFTAAPIFLSEKPVRIIAASIITAIFLCLAVLTYGVAP